MSTFASETGTASNSGTNPDALEECLSAILASPDFSVADYLNTALEFSYSSSSETSPLSEERKENELQRRMAELALQLQLQTQSCHEDIGRIGAELQAVLPRCSADVGRVSVGLQGLQMDAKSLLEATAVGDANNEVSSSLETLSTLHALQSGLTRTKEILTAAATWDKTLESVAPLLAQQNLSEAVAALAVLEKGERALRGMPNPEERVQAIAKTRQQVSTLLQPQLKHALAVVHTRLAPLQQCVEMYKQLDQMPTLIDEYVKHRPAAIHKAWFEYTPSIDNSERSTNSSGGTGSEFTTWLPGWLDAVLTLVSEERRQSTTIFGPELVPEVVNKVREERNSTIVQNDDTTDPRFSNKLSLLFRRCFVSAFVRSYLLSRVA